MTKASAYALSLALLTHSGRRVAADCPAGSVASIAADTCDYASFEAGLQGACTVADLFPNATVAAEEIAELCEYDAPTQFIEISGYYQSDRLFFAGGGELTWAKDADEFDQVRSDLVRFAASTGDSSIIAYPDYLAREVYNQQNGLGNTGQPPNLNIDAECDLNTIMCCYTDDSHGDAFPSSTDVCYHDLADSREANHITNGWSVFPGRETSTYCAGFTWAEADQDTDLLGNSLYGVSYRMFEEKKYMMNIPGAPLCGCVENMPVVENADCLKATATNVQYTFTVNEDGSLSADNTATVSYDSCGGGDLKTESLAKGNAGIEEHLVGDGGCTDAIDKFLTEDELSSLGTSARSVEVDPVVWGDIFVGEGTYFQPPGLNRTELDLEFRAAVEAGCWDTDPAVTRPCIVRRRCNQCSQPTHYDIFYKRHTPLPALPFNFVDYFMNHFYFDLPDSKHKVDFDLYSTYDDALAETNPWLFCKNHNYWGVGFPYNCGPVKETHNQYNSYEGRRGWGHANHHGFYVEQPKAAP